MTDFELSDSEKNALRETASKYGWALDKLKELKRIIADEGLRYTKSGRLELRSHRAQDVQGAMNNTNQIIKDEKPVYEHLMGLPMERYKKARKHFSRYWACLLAFIVWFAIVATQPQKKMLVYHTYQTVEAVGTVASITDSDSNKESNTSTNNNSVDETQTTNERPTAQAIPEKPNITIWVTFFIMLIAYLVVFVIARIRFSSKHKKPKEINVASLF